MDRVASAIFRLTGLCLQPANRCVLCAILLDAVFAWRGTLALAGRCRIYRGDFLVVKGGATRSDPKFVLLAGLSADSWVVNDRDSGCGQWSMDTFSHLRRHLHLS